MHSLFQGNRLRFAIGTVIILASIVLSSFLTSVQPAKGLYQDPQITPTAQHEPNNGNPTVTRTISVTGAGSVETVPDIAIVSLGVRTEAETAREALTQNNTQMQTLITAIRATGVAQVDIRTRFIQIQPSYRFPQPDDPSPGSPTIVGYIASNSVDVTVRNINNLGALLDGAVSAGSNQVDGIRFDVSQPQPSMEQAREAAMQDARRKAEQLAELAGARLGAVITINESSYIPLPFDQMQTDMARTAVESVPVSPGSQRLEVNVQVTWELIPGQP